MSSILSNSPSELSCDLPSKFFIPLRLNEEISDLLGYIHLVKINNPPIEFMPMKMMLVIVYQLD
jgi:hypothetical protein